MNIDGKHAIGSAPRWRGRVRRSPTSPRPSRQGPRSCETTVRARHGGLCARWAQAEARTCSQDSRTLSKGQLCGLRWLPRAVSGLRRGSVGRGWWTPRAHLFPVPSLRDSAPQTRSLGPCSAAGPASVWAGPHSALLTALGG